MIGLFCIVLALYVTFQALVLRFRLALGGLSTPLFSCARKDD